jgi:hypothetical protein
MLDPARHVLAAERLACVSEHSAAVVSNELARLVERYTGRRRSVVLDRAEHELAREFLEFARTACSTVDQLIALEPKATHPASRVAEYRDRRAEERKADAHRPAVRRPVGVAAQDLDVLPVRPMSVLASEPGGAFRVQLELCEINDHVGPLELTHLE